MHDIYQTMNRERPIKIETGRIPGSLSALQYEQMKDEFRTPPSAGKSLEVKNGGLALWGEVVEPDEPIL